MKLIKLKGPWIIIMILFIITSSCKKFLDQKPDQKLAVPSTLYDLQTLLDNYSVLPLDPASDEVSADNYYLTTTTWQSLSLETDRRMYTWEKDNIFQPVSGDWVTVYRKIYYYNTVLDYLQKIPVTTSNAAEWNHIKGQALMLRAKSFLQAAVIWSLAYDPATAAADLGIPLKLKADLNEVSVRSSVEQTYEQVIGDLKASVPLLPPKAIHVVRASRSAAYAFLARTYLAMRDYANAGRYADSCLQISNTLLNYNTLSTTATYPFSQYNTEVLFQSAQLPPILANTRAKIDSALYASYAANDCRKTIFFKANTDGTWGFKGSYDGSGGGLHTGIATDEVYLMRAECFARAGNTAAALTDLNTLLQMRMKTGTFIPVTAGSPGQALFIILQERRKELLMRCTRWMDIKRLNKEGAGITLKRIVNNQVYTLPPNDLRYALAIPEYIIDITGMPQNPR